MSEELLRPRDVAKIFGISVKTLWKWQRRGIPESERLMGFVKPDVSRKAVIYVRFFRMIKSRKVVWKALWPGEPQVREGGGCQAAYC